jgi:hypothetical protein
MAPPRCGACQHVTDASLLKERKMTGSLKRIGALFYARNLEFVRDRAALVWNLLFPLLLVIGFSLIFSGPPKPLVQIGVVG